MNNRELGSIGEDFAARYLEKKGCEIVKRNYRCKLGEIDIISHYMNEIIFTEVKTRRNLKFGQPCDAVDEKKKKKIRAVANFYILENRETKNNYNYDFSNISFNVIEILINDIEYAF